MGCDIHPHAEVRDPKTGIWEERGGDFSERHNHRNSGPFDWRSYGLFAFLTGGVVRNYSGIEGIGVKPRGLPDDSPTKGTEEEKYGDYHSHSYLTLKELLDFDYDKQMEDRRVTRQIGNVFHGGCTCEPGGGEKETWREFLGPNFLKDLETLKAFGDPENVRVVFWFDN